MGMNGVPQIDPTLPFILLVPSNDGNVRMSTNVTNPILAKGILEMGKVAYDEAIRQAKSPSVVAAPASALSNL